MYKGAKLTKDGLVIVNFIRSWQTLFLGVSTRTFPEEISIQIDEMNKDFSSPMWTSISQCIKDLDRT
jgi:hypothetical protein